MEKIAKRVLFCTVLAMSVWLCALIADRQTLHQELVRLHVVAASDSASDQALKLQVKDAVVDSLKNEMKNLQSSEEALVYLQENLPKIERLANQVLREAGCEDVAAVSLGVEEFSKRVYDTFSLPAGLYDTLRITIGEGDGKNWWCVAFPALCLPATTEGFEETASCAGFSDSLTAALEGKEGYELRFWVLDALGRLENLLHAE